MKKNTISYTDSEASAVEWRKHCMETPLDSFQQTDDPEVSVIIPMHGQWELTRDCLASLQESAPKTPFEIIIVDDASPQPAPESISSIKGIRLIRHGENKGFIEACHTGASQARGKYLFFLNNDTIVFPGAVDAMAAMLDKRADAAIVGAKLLFENGHIQDGGGIIWNNGATDRFGQDHPFDSEYLKYPREVDYICGAALMTRREFWEKSGGFDRRFGKGYCEDSDYAMQARALGNCVFIEPAALVLHKESASMGAAKEDIISANRHKLQEKWADTLAKNHLPAPPLTSYHFGMAKACRTLSPEAKARKKSGKYNILYYSPWPTHPVEHGNQSSMVNFGKYFKEKGHNVHFACLSNMVTKEQVEAMEKFWGPVAILENRNIFPDAEDPYFGIPWDGWYDEGLGEQVLALCLKHDIDMVICSYIFQSKILEFVPDHILKVIDTHDRMGDRYAMLKEHDVPLHFFSTSKRFEGGLLKRADLVIARRDEERAYFDEAMWCRKSITIPHFAREHFQERKHGPLTDVGIVASQNYINCKFILDFLEVFNAELAGAECPFNINIAGNVILIYDELTPEQQALFDLPYVKLLGYVPDLADFYRQQSLIICPVTMGTGINIKTVEAFSYGAPVLSTQCGSKGTTSTDFRHQYPDNDLGQFVKALFELHKDPEELQELAEASRDIFHNYERKLHAGLKVLFNHPKLKNH